MSLAEIYLPQPVFVFSIQCVTQRSSTTSSTSFCGQHVQLRCFCIGLANCYFAERGAKHEKNKLNIQQGTRTEKIIQQARENLAEPTVRSRPPGGWPDQSIQAFLGTD